MTLRLKTWTIWRDTEITRHIFFQWWHANLYFCLWCATAVERLSWSCFQVRHLVFHQRFHGNFSVALWRCTYLRQRRNLFVPIFVNLNLHETIHCYTVADGTSSIQASVAKIYIGWLEGKGLVPTLDWVHWGVIRIVNVWSGVKTESQLFFISLTESDFDLDVSSGSSLNWIFVISHPWLRSRLLLDWSKLNGVLGFRLLQCLNVSLTRVL